MLFFDDMGWGEHDENETVRIRFLLFSSIAYTQIYFQHPNMLNLISDAHMFLFMIMTGLECCLI